MLINRIRGNLIIDTPPFFLLYFSTYFSLCYQLLRYRYFLGFFASLWLRIIKTYIVVAIMSKKYPSKKASKKTFGRNKAKKTVIRKS